MCGLRAGDDALRVGGLSLRLGNRPSLRGSPEPRWARTRIRVQGLPPAADFGYKVQSHRHLCRTRCAGLRGSAASKAHSGNDSAGTIESASSVSDSRTMVSECFNLCDSSSMGEELSSCVPVRGKTFMNLQQVREFDVDGCLANGLHPWLATRPGEPAGGVPQDCRRGLFVPGQEMRRAHTRQPARERTECRTVRWDLARIRNMCL